MGLRADFSKFAASVRHALAGIVHGFLTERHVQIHFIVASLVILSALLLPVSKLEWLALILAIGTTIALELVNTAIERIVDLVSERYHPLAKAAKDCAAGAVLISAIASVIIGCIIFIPHIIELFGK